MQGKKTKKQESKTRETDQESQCCNDEIRPLADSGANTGISTTTDKMQNLKEKKQRIKVGGHTYLYSTHKGDMVVLTEENEYVVLREMLVVPDFGQDVMNVRELAKNRAESAAVV